MPWTGNLEFALLADGVPTLEEVYELMQTPEGLDRALAKLDTIKDEVVWIDTGAESVQFILDGQCDLGVTWSGRPALRVRDEGLPLAINWQDALYDEDTYVIPKGDKNYKAALSALAYAMVPRNQCEWFNIQGYGNPMDVAPFPDCLTDFGRAWGIQFDEVAGDQSDEFYQQFGAQVIEEFTAWLIGG